MESRESSEREGKETYGEYVKQREMGRICETERERVCERQGECVCV